MKPENIKIGNLIWVMKHDRPVLMTVSKVVTTDEIEIDTNAPIQNIMAYATYSKIENNQHTIIPDQTFETLEELKARLFDFKY